MAVHVQVTKFARNAATTFAPRASGPSKNPAYPGEPWAREVTEPVMQPCSQLKPCAWRASAPLVLGYQMPCSRSCRWSDQQRLCLAGSTLYKVFEWQAYISVVVRCL